jgi:thiosulfate dehydrogenase
VKHVNLRNPPKHPEAESLQELLEVSSGKEGKKEADSAVLSTGNFRCTPENVISSKGTFPYRGEKPMGKFIVGLVVGILLAPAGFYFYVRSGHAPVATAAPPMPFEKFFATTALHATLARVAPKTHTTQASEGLLLSGVDVYRHHCGGCHGLPGRPVSAVAKGMFPVPPQLLELGQMVTDDPVGYTYWKVKHGIRLSGMPSFQTALSDEQIWAVSLFLANADKLPPTVKDALNAPPPWMAHPPERPAEPGPKLNEHRSK